MPVTFNSDVSGAAATSTVTLAFALTYCDSRDVGGENAFTRAHAAEPENARRLLNRACAELELLEPSLCGTRATTAQSLSQPRINPYRDPCASYVRPDVLAGTAIALQWQHAQCERAIEIAEELEKATAAATTTDLLAPFSEIKAGGVELKMREAVVVVQKLSKAVRDRISIFRKSAGGIRMVRQ